MAEAAVILGLVAAVLATAVGIKDMYLRFGSPKPDALKESDLAHLSQVLRKHNLVLSVQSVLPPASGAPQDATVNTADIVETSSDLLRKAGLLWSRKKDLERLAKDPANVDDQDKVLKEADLLIQDAKKLEQEVLPLFSGRRWFRGGRLCFKPKKILHAGPIDNSGGSRTFCKGALICQQGRGTVEDLVDEHMRLGSGFICRHCHLQVADHSTPQLSDKGEVSVPCDLPASHLMACESLKKLHAYYRCLICYRRGANVDFAKASDLEYHVGMTHEGDILVLDDEEGSKALERELENVLSEDMLASQIDPNGGSKSSFRKTSVADQVVDIGSGNDTATPQPPPEADGSRSSGSQFGSFPTEGQRVPQRAAPPIPSGQGAGDMMSRGRRVN
ncbi:hypothetical protein ACHAQA_004180 [Verticillium albo-atrum]